VKEANAMQAAPTEPSLRATAPSAAAPVGPLESDAAGAMVALSAERLAAIEAKAAQFVALVLREPVRSEPFRRCVEGVHELGGREIEEASGLASRLLARPVSAMKAGGLGEGSAITRSLLDLRRTLEDLDPARRGNLFEPRRLLGLIPWGNRLEEYFREYQSAESHLQSILESLHRGQDELRLDNASIEQEKGVAWQSIERLRQYAELGSRIDAGLALRLPQLEASDPEKARVLRDEVLFYVRQKVQDVLTQLAVTVQGYLAMDLVRRNNLELIKGVDRATTTTIAALRTAVIVAQALGNQKLVLEQIGSLNAATGNMIASTSSMLKTQAGAVHSQASSSTVELAKLREAFSNVFETMDRVDQFKAQALAGIAQTVEALNHELERARPYLERARMEPPREPDAPAQAGAGDRAAAVPVPSV
jgi:uncharacterized protein YaaN involved in tellurite resistance